MTTSYMYVSSLSTLAGELQPALWFALRWKETLWAELNEGHGLFFSATCTYVYTINRHPNFSVIRLSHWYQHYSWHAKAADTTALRDPEPSETLESVLWCLSGKRILSIYESRWYQCIETTDFGMNCGWMKPMTKKSWSRKESCAYSQRVGVVLHIQ